MLHNSFTASVTYSLEIPACRAEASLNGIEGLSREKAKDE